MCEVLETPAMFKSRIMSRYLKCVLLVSAVSTAFLLGLNAPGKMKLSRAGLKLALDKKAHPLSHQLPFAFVKKGDGGSKNGEGAGKNASAQLGILARESWMSFVDRHNYSYVLDNRLKCVIKEKMVYEEVTVIAIVASEPTHFKQRNAIRMTWIRHALENKLSVRVMFMLGLNTRRSVQSQIRHESQLYGDIIQETFKDTYLNLTVKTIGALKWATRSCPRAKFFIKLDDDVALNIGNLTGFLEFEVPSTNYLAGILRVGAVAVRDPREKFYVSEDIMPMAIYPPYPEGKAYVMSMDVARRIYRLATDIPIWPWEDAFIGLCAQRLGIVPQDIFNFYGVRNVRDPWTGLVKTQKSLKDLYVLYMVYDLDVGEMLQVWKAWMTNSWN